MVDHFWVADGQSDLRKVARRVPLPHAHVVLVVKEPNRRVVHRGGCTNQSLEVHEGGGGHDERFRRREHERPVRVLFGAGHQRAPVAGGEALCARLFGRLRHDPAGFVLGSDLVEHGVEVAAAEGQHRVPRNRLVPEPQVHHQLRDLTRKRFRHFVGSTCQPQHVLLPEAFWGPEHGPREKGPVAVEERGVLPVPLYFHHRARAVLEVVWHGPAHLLPDHFHPLAPRDVERRQPHSLLPKGADGDLSLALFAHRVGLVIAHAPHPPRLFLRG
mmetsp:Transcript_58576/g.117653  ORF Transcript_58576/g.117653 Transcript_58576/m.117653 type:complete len:272 (-) Transcript_58576:456-1271(-)